jgi:dipeptidyl aminopeptidase/acylaminoacyl peptidase
MRAVEPDDLLALKTAGDVQIDPAGTRVAYVLNEIDSAQDEARSSIWVVEIGPGFARRFTTGPKRDSAPRWSPDGRWLAFLSDREKEKAQLYLIPAEGGEAQRLTDLEEGAGPAVWSPDGARLAFAARVPRESAPEDEAAKKRWEQRPRVVTRAHYKTDGSGFNLDATSHLFVASVEGLLRGEAEQPPKVVQITFGEGDCRAPAWSPDGARLAYCRDRDGQADFHRADIWIAGGDGSDDRRLTAGVGRATSPSWSPDGSRIAFFATDEDEPGLGDPALHVYVADVDGAGGGTVTPRRVAPQDDRSANVLRPPMVSPGPAWAADGTSVLYAVDDAGSVALVRSGLEEPMARTVVGGERWIATHSVTPGGEAIAFSASDPLSPGDVFCCAADGRSERRLTEVNRATLESLTLARIERRTFTTPGGDSVDGWLYLPPQPGPEGQPAAPGPLPLLLHVHGGPHSFAGNTFPFSAFMCHVLPGRGWAVLALNPSGSGSYSKDFAHRIRGRWGELDLPQQLGAADALVAEGIADGGRLAIAGYSYGGYMTSWAIGQTNRFRAAIVGAPVTNLESFSGTSDIGPWFGPWEMGSATLDREGVRETMRRLSPISYAERVQTPTLIVHGTADDRCPIGQGEELFAALIAAGRAPAELVRYPGGAHGFVSAGRPSHRVDYVRRAVEWLERFTLRDAER